MNVEDVRMAATDDLIAAVNADDADAVSAMLRVDPVLGAARDEHGVSALMLSRYRFSRPVTDALLAVDPDLDVYEATTLGDADRLRSYVIGDPGLAKAFSSDGFTALHFAAFFGEAATARILIDAGADVNVVSRNPLGVQPLHSAVAGRHHEVCRVLVAAGADVTATQQDRYTPLHQAAQHGERVLVDLFLAAGADPLAKLDDGRTPADVADDPEVKARLREAAEARGQPRSR